MSEKTNDRDRPDRPDLPRSEFEALHSFQGVMFEKLAANRHKGGWSQDTIARLLERLEGELVELRQALDTWSKAPPVTSKEEEAARKVAREAADVANFAMMIADNVGGLSYMRRG